MPLCVDGSNAQRNRYPGIEPQLTDHTRANNKTQCPFVKRGNKYGVYVKIFARGEAGEWGWGETCKSRKRYAVHRG